MRSFSVSFLLFAAAASGFRPAKLTKQPTVICKGLFDGFINSMEAGYKGEDSAFQKQKAADAKKREEQRKRAEERKSRGYTELKDVAGKKTSVMVKYEESETTNEEKKFFGIF
jgi:hypothetical protein